MVDDDFLDGLVQKIKPKDFNVYFLTTKEETFGFLYRDGRARYLKNWIRRVLYHVFRDATLTLTKGKDDEGKDALYVLGGCGYVRIRCSYISDFLCNLKECV